MAFAIFVGLTVVICKITDLKSKSKSETFTTSEMFLESSEKIDTLTPCGNKLCLMTRGNSLGYRLIIVDTDSGQIQSVITMKEKQKLTEN